MRRIVLAAIAAASLLTACGTAVDDSKVTAEDVRMFSAAWSQQTEDEKDSLCLMLVLYGEQGVADKATVMDRPKVFAHLMAETCRREGR